MWTRCSLSRPRTKPILPLCGIPAVVRTRSPSELYMNLGRDFHRTPRKGGGGTPDGPARYVGATPPPRTAGLWWRYFHSHILETVSPEVSTSYSNAPQALL